MCINLCKSFAGADAVTYIVNHAEVAAVFCTPDKLQTVSYCRPLKFMQLVKGVIPGWLFRKF